MKYYEEYKDKMNTDYEARIAILGDFKNGT